MTQGLSTATGPTQPGATRAQPPAAGPPVVRAPAPMHRLDVVVRPLSGTTQARLGVGADWELEESFDCTIEEIREDSVRVHTVSSEGEEGGAWVPMDQIPKSEQKWIALGAPLRVAILFDRNAKTRKRQKFIRVLRPEQWRAPVSEAAIDKIADRLYARMQELLQPQR